MRHKSRPIAFSLSHERLELLRHLASSSAISVDDYALTLVERHLTRKLRKWAHEDAMSGEAPLYSLLDSEQCAAPPLPPPAPEKKAGRKRSGHIDFAAINHRSRPSFTLVADLPKTLTKRRNGR